MHSDKKPTRFRALLTLLLALMLALSFAPVYAAENGDEASTDTTPVGSASFVPVDRALNSTIDNIKVSSIRKGSRPENVFKAGLSDFWDVDQSQSTADAVAQDKNQFWIAVDLQEPKDIYQFVIAFQTNFTQLKDRVSQYRIEYTNDTEKWDALSTTSAEGAAGLESYNKPVDWTVAFTQNTADLVDGNGNKTMVYTLDDTINTRYVMITGEMKPSSSFVRIFNFMVNAKQEVEQESVVYPTEHPADIVPVYPGMSMTIGRPALVELGKSVPMFTVAAKQDITISGVLKDPGGKSIYTLPGQSIAKDATVEITPTAAAGVKGTYVMEFTLLNGEKQYFDKYYFTSVTGAASYTDKNPYPAVSVGGDGKLVYTPDYKGNHVIDYSNVGYKGGGAAIPNVPVKIILQPVSDDGDNYTRIQNAIDALSRINPDNDGYRGAILLKAETYRISKTLSIRAGGIVIKGEGNGTVNKDEPPMTPDNWRDYAQSETPEAGVTKLVATWKSSTYDKSTALISVEGSKSTTNGSAVPVVDQYVPAGSHTIHLESVSDFNVGGTVNVKKAVNRAWVHDLYMDAITESPGIKSENQWSSNMHYWDDLIQERTITAVDTAQKTITLGEPLADTLDMKYGISTVTPYNPTGRIENVGIENLQLISRFDKSITGLSTSFGTTYKQYEDELHAQVGVKFIDAQNVWVRNYNTYHLDVAVSAGNGVKWLTIQDANVLEFVSKTTAGERRYGFTIAGGQLVLTQRAFVRHARHGYIVMGAVSGPNVFYNSTSLYNMDSSEPHLRWSTGGLYDNMNARIYVQDRWNNGTAHGWAGSNYTLWNNNGPYIISQPPLNANYLFGQSAASPRVPFIMENVDPGNVPNFPAYEYGNGKAAEPKSLYIQQLTDRLGAQAAANISSTAVPAYVDSTSTLNTYVPKLKGIYLDGKLVDGFDPVTTTYTVPIPLDYEKLPVLTAVGEEGSKVTVSQPADPAKSPFAITVDKGTDIHGSYSVKYEIIPKNQKVTASNGSSSVLNLIDDNKNTGWSASANEGVWARFYLGDKPKIINSVSIGFNKDTQNRRQYYFDMEVSMDGVKWTKLSNPAWKLDNLGNGHMMSHLVMPGTESSLADLETFTFAAPVEARLVRITGFGTRIGTGTGTANANTYYTVDIEAHFASDTDLNDPLSEADFAKMLAMYLVNTDKQAIQKKVPGGHGAQSYYDELAQWELPLTGYSDDKAKDSPITRGRLAQIIAAKNGFHLSETQAVSYLYENNLSSGTVAGRMDFDSFGADQAVTRGQALVFFKRLSETKATAFQGKPSTKGNIEAREIGGIKHVPMGPND